MDSNPTPRTSGLSPSLLSLDDFRRWLSYRYRESTVATSIKRIKMLLKRFGSFEELLEQEKVVNHVIMLSRTPRYKHGILIVYLRFLNYAEQRPLPLIFDALKNLDRLAPRRLARIPSISTAAAAITALKRSSKVKIAMALALYAGLRLHEINKLRWSQIDLQNKRIIIEESDKRSEGSILPLSDKLVAILSSMPESIRDSVYVCRINQRTVSKTIRRLRKRLMAQGYQDAEYLNLKNLRHLYATQLYTTTKDLVYVQRMMRHRSISSTMRYIHMVVEEKSYVTKAVHKRDLDTIKELLDAGYDYVLSSGDYIFLRRLVS